MPSFQPGKTPNSRVFLIEGQARPDHDPDFQDCMMAGSPEQSFGDVEPIQCPSADEYGAFVEIGQIQGAIERAGISLTGHYAADLASTLLRLGRRRCPNDIQVHFGRCTDPTDFNTFTKSLIMEQALITNWSAEDLGTLASEGSAAINETADISAKTMYEVLQLTWQERGKDVVTNPVVDVVICSKPECGDCDEEDDGCQDIYAITGSTAGSPGTAPDIIYSTDNGVTLASDEITTMVPADTGSALACLGTRVVAISNDDDAIHWKLKTTIDAGTAANWNRVTTGVVAAGSLRDIWSVGNYAFLCGDAGYVYGTSSPPAGVTVLDAGVATTQQLNAVHAISDQFAVAVGEAGAVVFTQNQTTWSVVTAPAAISLQAVWIKNENEWFVIGSAGALYYTLDQGTTWTQITDLPVTLTAGYDVAMATDSVMYLGGSVAGPAAVVLRSFDGGNSWVETPEGVGNMPAADQTNALAACVNDVNFAVAVGLADNAVDGWFVVGLD